MMSRSDRKTDFSPHGTDNTVTIPVLIPLRLSSFEVHIYRLDKITYTKLLILMSYHKLIIPSSIPCYTWYVALKCMIYHIIFQNHIGISFGIRSQKGGVKYQNPQRRSDSTKIP
jgi:hypothetical protein